MSLLEACNAYLTRGQQGQLIVKFAGDVHLCKILVDNGEAVHIAHGRTTPELILKSLPAKTVEWVNFIAGYPVRKRLELPLHQTLLQLAKAQPKPEKVQPQTSADPVVPIAFDEGKPRGPVVSAATANAAIEGFIDRIGPLGTILAEQIAASLSYSIGEPLPQSTYVSFIDALCSEIPEKSRRGFLQQFGLKTP